LPRYTYCDGDVNWFSLFPETQIEMLKKEIVCDTEEISPVDRFSPFSAMCCYAAHGTTVVLGFPQSTRRGGCLVPQVLHPAFPLQCILQPPHKPQASCGNSDSKSVLEPCLVAGDLRSLVWKQRLA